LEYIKLLNAFYDWCESNYLPPLQQLIWFRLTQIFNSSKWSEWVQVDNRKLMALTQISNEKTFISNRDQLLEKGFFDYVRGKKRCPNKYRITDKLTCKFTVNLTVETTANPTDIIKTKSKTKIKTKQEISPKRDKSLSSPKGEDLDILFKEFWSAYPKKQNKPCAVRVFGKIKPMSHAVLGEILLGVERWKNSDQWINNSGQYIPYPATFLNNRKWEDEVTKGSERCGFNCQNSGRKICTEYPE
jgi:hypothetical protein